MENSKLKQYLITIIIQIVLVTIYTVCNFYLLQVEQVALSPLKYLIPLGIAFLLINIGCIVLIFRSLFVKDNSEEVYYE